jgi:hypothetical protein
MTKSSMLAAVHAAALSSASVAALSVEPQPTQEPSMSEPKITTAELHVMFPTSTALAAVFPDLCAALRVEGATAERERISGIEAHSLAGHEDLIATMKADPKVTPDMAAGRLLAAEKALRGQQLQGIKDVENLTGKVPATATTAPSAAAPEMATDPEGWKAEYAKSEALQAEFGSEGSYLAFKTADKSGVARIKRSS